MHDRDYIKFLGTAGARFVVARQLRYSAGVFIQMKGKKIVLDPGPGALLRCARSRPPIDVTALDAIILTHAHIDHANDVNILIDAMTSGGLKRRGTLFAPAECLEGEHRVVLNYLRGFLERIEVLKSETAYRLGPLSFVTSVRHLHSAETYGIQFRLGKKKISFMADTKFFPGLIPSYRGSRLLVVNVLRRTPYEYGEILHLSLDDAKTIIRLIRPEKAIITHLGMTLLGNPAKLSRQLTGELGVEVTVATDGMTVPLD